jgi:hypothetical protein
VELQQKRHDPRDRVKTVDGLLAIRTGRSSVARLVKKAGEVERKRFLTLLMFEPR